jgi:hypothetical protein
MMKALSFGLLDPFVSAERELYERTFYAAFERAAGNRLIRQLWIFDDERKRLATRIPYEDQVIYVLRGPAGRIVTALGVNVAMRSFQASAFGFGLPDDAGGYCELLTMFSVGEYRLESRYRFISATFGDLYRRGFHTALATTAQRVLRTYVRNGARVIAEKEIQDEMRYFLKFDLARKSLESFAHLENKGDL